MSLEIVFSSDAKQTFSAITIFIRDQWGVSAAERFVKKVYDKIDLISVNPHLYKASGIDPDIRVAFITAQCSLVYKIHPDRIYLLYFWDNRQQPIT